MKQESKKLVFYANKGFTLLELVLVLFILAILTTTGLSFIENEDGQLRYNQSLEKLDLIADAVLREREHQGSTFYSGFVSDNGLIPPQTDLEPLTDNDASWSDSGGNTWIGFAEITPHYYNPVSTGEQILDDTSNPEFNLYKGFRGPYLLQGLDANNEFRDGWGNNFVVASASNIFSYAFDRDNASIPTDFNGTDVTQAITEPDWTIAPTALNITIENNTGATVTANTYELAVVIFENNAIDTATVPEDRWTTYHFTQDVDILDTGTFSSSTGTWLKDGGAIGTNRLPVGEHIALLIDRAATIDGVTEIDDSVRFTIFAGTSNQPEIILTVP